MLWHQNLLIMTFGLWSYGHNVHHRTLAGIEQDGRKEVDDFVSRKLSPRSLSASGCGLLLLHLPMAAVVEL